MGSSVESSKESALRFLASTIVDLTDEGSIKLVRQGRYPFEKLGKNMEESK
jgi:tRNA A37 threonylcarbamoyladenosine synthetase subunit TsaC/SUA5/YrdC